MKLKSIVGIVFMMFGVNFTSFALVQEPPDISCYEDIRTGIITFDTTTLDRSTSYIDAFWKQKALTPLASWLNSGKMKKFLNIPRYKELINNTTSGEDLCYTEFDKYHLPYDDELGKTELYVRYHSLLQFPGSGWFDIRDYDLSDIENGKVLLRVNKKQGVVYTVRKTSGDLGSEYVFRSYLIGPVNSDNSIDLYLKCQCCIEQLPNMLFLKNNIKIGVTTLDEVKENLPDTKFNLSTNGEEGSSEYACADKYGTIVYVYYKKDATGTFRVENINWTFSGYNVLPYLLPIDRQLIDPSYNPPEESEEQLELTDDEESENHVKSNNGCCLLV